MQIIRTAKDLKSEQRRVCLAMGFFDGVHLGHQQIIRQTVADAGQHDAAALVVTFDRHPNSIVAPTRVPLLIYSLPQKLRTIASLGADALLLLHFDRRLSQRSGESFVRRLFKDLGPIHSICVGADFQFGHQRSGNVVLLRQLGAELSFVVHGVAAVSLDREVVRSTRIRQAIQTGKLDAAGQMLGRPYSICGLVVKGDRFGQRLGFPTCNLDVGALVLPPHGVYAVRAIARGMAHRAVLNIGIRPTLKTAVAKLQVEAHLLDFHGDLYGEEMEITFVQNLRAEQRFPSLDALKRQIARDIARARNCF